MTWILLILIVLLLLFVVGRIVAGRATPAKPLGVVDGKLAPCPNSPNCVSSFAPADDTHHRIPPIASTDREKLLATLNAMPRTTIERDEGDYIHATQRSAAWGFIDDIEFIIGDEQIDVRSASRTGYSDMGVNRNRVEQIRGSLINNH